MTIRPECGCPYRVHTTFEALTTDGRRALVFVPKDAVIFVDLELRTGHVVKFSWSQKWLCVDRVTLLNSADWQSGTSSATRDPI